MIIPDRDLSGSKDLDAICSKTMQNSLNTEESKSLEYKATGFFTALACLANKARDSSESPALAHQEIAVAFIECVETLRD